MSRASRIYVVQDQQLRVVAAFTVKWELKEWLSEHDNEFFVVVTGDGMHQEPYNTKEL